MQKLMIKKKLKVYREGLPFSKFLNKLCTSGASQVVLMVKNLAANSGDIRNTGSIPGLGRFPGEWHGNPLQYSCLENLMDRGVWWDTVHRVENSGTPLKRLSMQAQGEYIFFQKIHFNHAKNPGASLGRKERHLRSSLKVKNNSIGRTMILIKY